MNNLYEMDFNSRDSWLAWRKEWKATYKAISQTIRNDKTAWKTQQRRVTVVDGKWGNEAQIDSKAYFLCHEYCEAFFKLNRDRDEARNLLALLGNAYSKKEESMKVNT